MRLLITEVTEMHSASYCVAGWRARTGTMVRPLPHRGIWSADLLLKHGIVPGATLRIRSDGTPSNGSYPHRTEDTLIELASIKPISPGMGPWFGPGSPATATTVLDAFQGHLKSNSERNGCRKGAYVTSGTQTRSLYGLAIDRAGVRLFEDRGKLRAYLDDGSWQYNVPVSCRTLLELFHGAGGLAGTIAALSRTGRLHVRIGLARAWDRQPDQCYVMVNGVHW